MDRPDLVPDVRKIREPMYDYKDGQRVIVGYYRAWRSSCPRHAYSNDYDTPQLAHTADTAEYCPRCEEELAAWERSQPPMLLSDDPPAEYDPWDPWDDVDSLTGKPYGDRTAQERGG